MDGIADPCSEASLFWGDQALTEDDVKRIFGRSTTEVQNDLKQATDLGWQHSYLGDFKITIPMPKNTKS